MREKRSILIFLVVVLIVVVAYFLRRSFQFDVNQLKEFVLSLGIFGPLMIIFLIIISIVFAPIAAFPFWLSSLALYGFWLTLVIVLAANSLGSAINFWLARRWGRSLVVKFVGQKGLKKIDEIAEVMGLQILVLGRIFGGASGDYLSYAAGLTQIKFRPYFLITLFGTLPIIILNILIVHQALVVNPLYLVGLAIIGYTLAIGFPILIYRKKTRSSLENG